MSDEANYERLPADQVMDETDISLRAYLSRLDDKKLAEYDASWSDEQLIEWDGNFRADGALMLVCCERDVDVHEYRRVLEQHLQFRRNAAGGAAGFEFRQPPGENRQITNNK